MPTHPKRSWFRPRFTLAALLVLILVCAIPLAYIARLRAHNAARLAAYERLVGKGVRFVLENSPPPSPGGNLATQSWWEKVFKETPRFRSIEVVEGYSAGKPPAVNIIDDDLRLFAHFPEIEELHIAGADYITDVGLGSLADLPRLRNVHTNLLRNINGSFLEAWAESDTVEKLLLLNLAKLEGRRLSALGKMTHLKSVSLNSCIYLDTTPLDGVDMPEQLTELRIEHTPITDEALARWLSQTQLRTLVLDTAFTRKVAPQLRRQTQISYLSITNAPLLDEDLQFLGRCPALYNVAIFGAPVQGAFLRRIPDETQLDFLTLRGAPLVEENVTQLKRLRKLVYIDLSWTPIQGACFARANWPALQQLQLRGCRFSEQGKTNLTELTTPPNLEFPSNWTALDLRRYKAGKAPANVTLGNQYVEEAKSNAIAVNAFYSPNAQFPKIDRCPLDAMTPVTQLLEQAKTEAANLEAKQEQE